MRCARIALVLAGLALCGVAMAHDEAAEAPAGVAVAPVSEVDADAAARRVFRLADQLHSPFCPGKTLMTCTSAQAMTLRQDMRQLALSGMSDEEIIAELQRRYDRDDFKVSNPSQPWYTFLVPFLPFVFGTTLVILVVRRWRRAAAGPEPEAAGAAPDADEDADRLARIRARVATPDEE